MASRDYAFIQKALARPCPPLSIAAGEINYAHAAIKRVRPVCCPGVIEIWIQNVFAMRPCRMAIIDEKCKDDFARGRFAVGDIFTPWPGPNSVTTEPITGVAPVAAPMSGTSAGLLDAMVGRRMTHSRRQRERLCRADGAKKAHSLVDRAQSFFHPPFRSSRENDKPVVPARTQLSDDRRIKGGRLSREIHFSNDGAGRNAFTLTC